MDDTELPSKLRNALPELAACVFKALKQFASEHALLRHKYTKLTEANLIRDYMVAEARALFPWKLKNNLFVICPIDSHRIKLKKLTPSLRTSNQPTQLVLRYDHQKPLRLFDDMDLVNLYLGYQRHEVEILQSRIWVVCPRGQRIAWALELTQMLAGATAVSVPQPIPLAPPKRRVRAKTLVKPRIKRAVSKE
jgi:hypothetical protein